MSEQSLRDRADAAGFLTSSKQIGAGDLRRLCCDADITPNVLGSTSEILDVGTTQRLVTPAIRRALSYRDNGCVFPRCDLVNEQVHDGGRPYRRCSSLISGGYTVSKVG